MPRPTRRPATTTTLPVIENHWTDLAQGDFRVTGNPLDFAIDGRRPFRVQTPRGVRYTRNGNFRVSPAARSPRSTAAPCGPRAAGRFVLQPGMPVEVLPDGTVRQGGQIGRPDGTRVIRPPAASIRKAPTISRRLPERSRKPPPAPVLQGKLEASNVGAAESAVRLVAIMRQFEMLQKAMTIGNDMNKRAIEEVARVSVLDNIEKESKMIRALYSAASGMTAQQLNIDNIANNLANANTAGYKSRRAQFQDLLYQNMVPPGSSAGQSTVVPTGLAARPRHARSSNEIIFQQGDFARPAIRSIW